MKPETMIVDYALNFFDENFDRITYDIRLISDIKKGTKKEFLKLMEYPQYAAWGLTEIACWGMGDDYTKQIFIGLSEEYETDFHILKIKDKYIKLTFDNDFVWHFGFTEPKTKAVKYFG